ncbi:MAG TPA: pyruvate synthase [Deltaproteobacteria bacterium]|nr:pyruvate synthase [Deltaproteobacteria bacterium]
MEGYVEVRWHGRAQQGIVTAAKMLGEAALLSGKYVQAFPEFGPERMGAPVKAFNRVSDEPIRLHCQVTRPDIVVIADPTLIGMDISGGMGVAGSVTDGTDEKAVFIVNTTKSAEQMRGELGVGDGPAVFTVDASRISMESLGRHMPNAPLLGALSRVTSLVPLDALTSNFRDNYSKKFSARVIEGNVNAIRRGYEEAA